MPQSMMTQDFHHDSAPTHSALSVQEYLAKNGMVVFLHTPYSPDLVPCDFLLPPKPKLSLKGRRFDDIITIQKQLQAILAELRMQGTYVNAFNNGINARFAISSHNGTTSKRTA
jgi:histone-lysine N-methyltransferase SETMAR